MQLIMLYMFNLMLGFNFIFLCFWGMIIYDNEFETEENKTDIKHKEEC